MSDQEFTKQDIRAYIEENGVFPGAAKSLSVPVWVDEEDLPPLDSLPWLDEEGEPIDELSIKALRKSLPQFLKWPSEPDAKSGDQFVFRWGKIQGVIDDPEFPEHEGKVYSGTFPDVYLELTAHPSRHRKGHWQAPFVAVGFDLSEPFMRRYAGTIPDPTKSIDKEVPLEAVEDRTDREADREDATLRHPKRLEEARRERRPGRWERMNRRAA